MACNQEGRDLTLEHDDQSTNGCVVEVEGAQISLHTQTLDEIISDKKNHLGSGSFADVYKHFCPVSNKVIALKRLKNARGKKSKPIAKDFLSEITVHKDLDHQNILKFFRYIKDRDVGIFLVIQYAEKGSLTDLMETEELDRNKMLIYIEQILQGLSYLHKYTNKEGQRQPIAHRDLRCHNVLMMTDGTLKIADFGLCKRLLEMAEASGISSKRGNSYWVGPELVDKKRRRDLPAETLVLTDVWSLGVLILELYYYGAYRVPYMNERIYTHEEYIFKLGRGWGPKIPEEAPEEIKTLLRRCFQYVIDDRASAEDLLKDMNKFDSKRKANLAITEHISYLSEFSSSSESDNTINNSRDPATTLEIDPLALAGMDDTEYLTKLHDPTTLTPHSVDQQNSIIKSITEDELNRYIAKGVEEFILKDFLKHDGTYRVKRKGNEEKVFSVFFRGDGKKLSLKRTGRTQTIFSIDSSNKRNRCFSASLAGGIFAHVNEPNIVKKALNWTNLRMEVNSISEDGAKTLDAMSPMSRRRLVTVPGTSSERSTDIFYTAKESLTAESLESLTRSSTEFTFDDKNLDVKKSQHEGYKYTIRHREDKAEIGYFNTLAEEDKCEILVTPDSNTALVATVVAYYYRKKRKKMERFEWTQKLSKRAGSFKNKFSDNRSQTDPNV